MTHSGHQRTRQTSALACLPRTQAFCVTLRIKAMRDCVSLAL